MKKKGSLVVGVGLLFIVIVALVVALWPSGSGQLSIGSDDIYVKWWDDKTLWAKCDAKNESDKDWEEWVMLYVENLDGKTLYDCTKESWLSMKIKKGEKTWVGAKIPFEEIKGQYSDDTIVVRFNWGSQKVEKEFKL